MSKGINKREAKLEYRVLKGIAGFPDEDGHMEDLLPYAKNTTAAAIKKHGKWKRDEHGTLVPAKVTVMALPSKVGHLVFNKSLILEKEFADFYPDRAEEEDGDTDNDTEDDNSKSKE